jgi:hypothetical protein
MRTLLYVPVIHAQADMGSLAPSVRERAIKILGTQKWLQSQNAITRLWEHIRLEVAHLELPYPRVRLYQDALPICGHEVQIVADLAKAGSANHQLLMSLINRGATLMGTESPELLLEEYQLVKESLDLPTDSNASIDRRDQIRTASARLLGERDRFICERINSTLPQEETGLLFLGMLHALDGWLASDIKVSYPILPPNLDLDLLEG